MLAVAVWLAANGLILAAAFWLAAAVWPAAAVWLEASGMAIAAATTPAIATIRVNFVMSFPFTLSLGVSGARSYSSCGVENCG